MRWSVSRVAQPFLRSVLGALALLLLSPWADPGRAAPPENENCLHCHQAMWERESGRKLVHGPFREQKCLFCHAVKSGASSITQGGVGTSDSEVRWIEKFKAAASSHWLEFKTEKGNSTLLLEVNDKQVNRFTREIPLPPLSELPEPPTWATPPQISEVRISYVANGVLPSVRISWKTDRPTSAVVYYGGKQLDLTADDSARYSTDHAITIICAKQCLNFSYKVVSEDFAGQKGVSDIYPLRLPTVAEGEVVSEENGASAPGPGKLEIEQTLFRRGERYLINVKAARPVQVALGIRDNAGGQQPVMNEGKKILRHIITADEGYTNISICYRCHGEARMVSRHPVNVFPKRGMRIPPDYPLLGDGRIACSTCHAPHASDFQFRTVKDHGQGLCLGCHQDRGKPVPAAR